MTRTGYFKCREVKSGFCRNRSMQTGSSRTLIGWKSGQTTFVPLWDQMEVAWLRTLVLSYLYSLFWFSIEAYCPECGKVTRLPPSLFSFPYLGFLKKLTARSVAWLGVYLLGYFGFSVSWMLTPLILSALR
jgi:hypothetical protein